jgi:DNA-directed RNA polymerase subunit RPC12/RpoP|tara:strand:- start:313 stop:486 length:174 start_codon:yes stop_codon:yes gene_type:complete
MQDPENVRSFYCMECGAEGDIEHELGDGYEVKYCPFCGSDLDIEDDLTILEDLDFDE